MGTATLSPQPLAVIPVRCWAAGLVACGCGRATAGHGHFGISLHLELWPREGGEPWRQWGLSNSRLPSWGPWVGYWGCMEALGMVTRIVRGGE